MEFTKTEKKSSREKQLEEIVREQDNINRWMLIIFMIIVVCMFFYIARIKADFIRQEMVLKQYKIFYDSVVYSTEYKAVKKCSTEDYWKAECILYELKKGEKNV